ncbi:permease prefix domain 2-containing transporter [Methylobacterium sp. Leaf91]|uniref:permease prefix domain 2-containing transporter n=1 Tax=Methylobacterium sp. Leaf91 TaxID=1736247 RepID=UPI0012E9689F|nr:permease prefix domain 2-containing transporter [Methylobacterium sp. Leaf91]
MIEDKEWHTFDGTETRADLLCKKYLLNINCSEIELQNFALLIGEAQDVGPVCVAFMDEYGYAVLAKENELAELVRSARTAKAVKPDADDTEMKNIISNSDSLEVGIQAPIRVSPPYLAEMLSRLVTKPKLRDRVLGSRAEKFHENVADRGVKTANHIYWIDTLGSCGPSLARLVQWTIAGDIIHRLFR